MHDPFGSALPSLQAPRLHLRHPRTEDAEAVWSIFSDPVAMRYWSHEPMTDRAEAVDYLLSIDAGFAERSLFQWAIALPDDQLVGTVTLHQWSRPHRRCELGYMLSRSLWGQGLASEAVRTILQFGFDQMELHRVEADVHPDNQGSVRLLERVGFQREGLLAERWFTHGEWSGSALYGLLRSAFVP